MSASVENVARLADLKAQACSQYADALRSHGQLSDAEEAFTVALRSLGEGTRDLHLLASTLTRLGSLRISQGWFDEGIELADKADIYRELGENHSAAKALIQKAMAEIHGGEADASISTLNQAIPLIDVERDSYLIERPLTALRVAWQKGILLRNMGFLCAAEKSLLQTYQCFRDFQMIHEAASVLFDLATIYHQSGDAGKLRQVGAELVPVLSARGVDRQVIETLLAASLPSRTAAPAAAESENRPGLSPTEEDFTAFQAEGQEAGDPSGDLLAELASLPRDEQVGRVANDERFADPHLVQKLIEMSEKARWSNPERMIHLADLARLVADACAADSQ